MADKFIWLTSQGIEETVIVNIHYVRDMASSPNGTIMHVFDGPDFKAVEVKERLAEIYNRINEETSWTQSTQSSSERQ